jgi:phage shock protein E
MMKPLAVLLPLALVAAACSEGSVPEPRAGAVHSAVAQAPTLDPVGTTAAEADPELPVPAPAVDADRSADRSPLYVDVRTRDEYAAGHVEGAILIPYDEMGSRWREIAEYADRPVVLYCRTGRRSGIAERILKSQGFSQVEDAGAFDRLAREGIPTATGYPSPRP